MSARSHLRFSATMNGRSPPASLLVDDFSRRDGRSALGTTWEVFSDRVMGGVSVANAGYDVVAGRPCLHLTGRVRLENRGGFIQAAVPLAASGTLDATTYDGVALSVFGNDERYAVHLKSADLRRPWEYYGAEFEAPRRWTEVFLPFDAFVARATSRPLDPQRLTRLGIVASGRAFHADLCVAEVRLSRRAGGDR
jgi:hypothetical protein